MCSVTLSLPDESLLALRLSAEQMADELRLAGAIKLYEVGRLSAGAAAQLAGMPTPLFLTRLASYNVAAFQLTDEELAEDLRSA